MRATYATLALCLLGVVYCQDIPAPAVCSESSGGQTHTLAANSTTTHWGYFYTGLTPKIVANSGDTVEIEMITHHAGDDYEKMIQGDPGIEDIYNWTSGGQTVSTRGAKGVGDGVHVMTGPIYVCGAEPGDVLEVQIADLKPRPNPSTGKTYGSNAAAWWGYQFRAGFLDNDEREVITIYEVVQEEDGLYVVPDYQFRFAGGPTGYKGPTTPCATSEGETTDTITGYEVEWANAESTFSGRAVPCVNGTQTWEG